MVFVVWAVSISGLKDLLHCRTQTGLYASGQDGSSKAQQLLCSLLHLWVPFVYKCVNLSWYNCCSHSQLKRDCHDASCQRYFNRAALAQHTALFWGNKLEKMTSLSEKCFLRRKWDKMFWQYPVIFATELFFFSVTGDYLIWESIV